MLCRSQLSHPSQLQFSKVWYRVPSAQYEELSWYLYRGNHNPEGKQRIVMMRITFFLLVYFAVVHCRSRTVTDHVDELIKKSGMWPHRWALNISFFWKLQERNVTVRHRLSSPFYENSYRAYFPNLCKFLPIICIINCPETLTSEKESILRWVFPKKEFDNKRITKHWK